MTSLLYFQTPRAKGTYKEQQKLHTEETALSLSAEFLSMALLVSAQGFMFKGTTGNKKD